MPVRLDPQCPTGNSSLRPLRSLVHKSKWDSVFSLSRSEGNVAHPLCSLMKIDFFLCLPKTASVVFGGCSQEQTLSVLCKCPLQFMIIGCTSGVPKWGIPTLPLAANKPSFRIVICLVWCFLTLVCLSYQSWISLLGRSILQSWYLFWAHHCVVCMWCCLEQEPSLCCLSPRTCMSGMNLFRELTFFSLGQTDLWSALPWLGWHTPMCREAAPRQRCWRPVLRASLGLCGSASFPDSSAQDAEAEVCSLPL